MQWLGRTVTEQFFVSFIVVGRKSTVYTVELFVEGNGAGEKAILVQAIIVTTDNGIGAESGATHGAMKAGTRDAGIKCLAELPNVGKGEGWSFSLVLKDGKEVMARTNYCWVLYAGRVE